MTGLGPSGGIGANGGASGVLVHRYIGFIETQVPLSILGVEGGSFVSSALTATAGGWTTGVAVVTGLGSPTPTVAISGTDTRTPLGGGTIALVAPMRVDSSFAGPYPVSGFLTLTFVPEPSTALLLSSGAAGLVALVRRRQRPIPRS